MDGESRLDRSRSTKRAKCDGRPNSPQDLERTELKQQPRPRGKHFLWWVAAIMALAELFSLLVRYEPPEYEEFNTEADLEVSSQIEPNTPSDYCSILAVEKD